MNEKELILKAMKEAGIQREYAAGQSDRGRG